MIIITQVVKHHHFSSIILPFCLSLFHSWNLLFTYIKTSCMFMVNVSLGASSEVKVLDHSKAQPWTTSLSQFTPLVIPLPLCFIGFLHTLSYPSRETSQNSRLIPLLICLLLAIFKIKLPFFDPVCMCMTF